MAKAAGRHLPIEREAPPRNEGELMELAGRLESLAQAQDEARDALGDGEPNDAVACGRLFAAVARLNPLHAAVLIKALAQSSSRPPHRANRRPQRLGHPCGERERPRGVATPKSPLPTHGGPRLLPGACVASGRDHRESPPECGRRDRARIDDGDARCRGAPCRPRGTGRCRFGGARRGSSSRARGAGSDQAPGDRRG